VTTRVRLLGPPRMEDDQQPRPRGTKSWALLARIALADRALSRREIAAELFGSADDPLGALRWSLADVRRCLGVSTALRGDLLSLCADDVSLDVWDLDRGTLPASEIGGALLEGMEVRQSPGFDTWLLLARSRSAARSREELRRQALGKLESRDLEAAVAIAGLAARLDPLDEDAQELFLRSLVAAGHPGQAAMQWAACSATFSREGLTPSPALRAAAYPKCTRGFTGERAALVSRSLLEAGNAAIAAGAADAGIETLRRAVDTADDAGDPALQVEVLTALGVALVHGVRGFDGEGAIVLHRALAAAGDARQPSARAELLRELAFVDVQAGRHSSADRALTEAAALADKLADEVLGARIEAVQGMAEADRGRHGAAVILLQQSADVAGRAGSERQQSWSLGVLARSLLLSGHAVAAREAAEASIEASNRARWKAFVPWSQVIRSEALAEAGDWDAASQEAEVAYALSCELGDPCWEGMSARAIGMIAKHNGDLEGARSWISDARRRCDRVPDRYVWVSAYIGLAELELGLESGPTAARAAAERLREDAIRADLPEFLAWALIHQAELGDMAQAPLARAAAAGVSNPSLQARVAALDA
jgi:DNA-binding SARP family transcriptional activator